MFFDPYVGIFGKSNSLTEDQSHNHWPHTINNIIVVIVLVTSYLFLCLIVALKSHFNQETNLNVIQRQTFIQVTLICFLNGTAASIYVYMQFFYTPTWLVIIGQITWQASHGAVVFVYLFLNPGMRHALFTKVFKFDPISTIATVRPFQNHTFANVEKTKL
uniref:7TM GPCR serpentine receptor class x (Srx) domain-containing protein n=1 Tax=Panagrolaimus sp. JU765 TaxID=591449 RepID=A0AC34RT55_9BILA